jgi:hypothetical protein
MESEEEHQTPKPYTEPTTEPSPQVTLPTCAVVQNRDCQDIFFQYYIRSLIRSFSLSFE